MPSQRYIHLDMLRGLAALAVCIGHIFGLIILSYNELAYPNPLLLPIYAMSALGHQAVMIFFALSGFLVGGQVIRQVSAGTWSLGPYLARRLSRLWVVLIPALIFTFLADSIGKMAGGAPGYLGAWYETFMSGPHPKYPLEESLKTFLGNTFFLQTIYVRYYGSNGPLWSLAWEFWYYIIFPFFFYGCVGKGSKRSRLVLGLGAVICMIWIPLEILILGLIWVVGASIMFLTSYLTSILTVRNWLQSFWLKRCLYIGLSIVFFGLLGLSLKIKGTGMDLALGLSCASLLPILVKIPAPGGLYDRIARGLSEISYTLYVFHFPLLAMIVFPIFKGQQLALGLTSGLWLLVLLLISLLFSTLMWWLFERNTVVIRKAITAKLMRPKAL